MLEWCENLGKKFHHKLETVLKRMLWPCKQLSDYEASLDERKRCFIKSAPKSNGNPRKVFEPT